MPLIIGTSGWQYRHWRETFYPAGTPQGRQHPEAIGQA